MKRGLVFLLIVVVVAVFVFGTNFLITGNVVGGPVSEGGYGGPSQEDMNCMLECVSVGCGDGDDACRVANSNVCGEKCGVETEKPKAVDEGEGCMQECIARGCDDEFDFNCQRANTVSCEDSCGMKGDAPDESEMDEEQLCIAKCVGAIDPSLICGAGKAEGEGEQGNAVCQKCASECEHLYSGPCLTDETWREKEDDCMSRGEHMEAAPIRGDSGEGYECTVDIECIDRSDEFGDEVGVGPGIGDEGYVAPNVVMKVIDNVVGFFKDLFR